MTEKKKKNYKLKHFEFRNALDDATIVVEQYRGLSLKPLWRVLVKYDDGTATRTFASGFSRKPNPTRIRGYIEKL